MDDESRMVLKRMCECLWPLGRRCKTAGFKEDFFRHGKTSKVATHVAWRIKSRFQSQRDGPPPCAFQLSFLTEWRNGTRFPKA